MKKFINKIKNNPKLYFLSILIVGVFFVLVVRITFAYLAPAINKIQREVVGTSDTVDDFKFGLGNPIKLSATPTTLPENGTNYVSSTTATAYLKANSTNESATFNYYVYFQITNTFKYSDGTTPEIILTVTNPNGDEITSLSGLTYGTFSGISGFDITTKSGIFDIATNYEITSNSSKEYTSQTWTFKITYLNLPIDQSSNFGKSMGVNVYIRKNILLKTLDNVCNNGDNLADCITTLSQKSISSDTNIYYHDANLENGANDNSYRYAGPSEQVNNFICFGSTTSPCPTDNLYRIIGVIDGKVKLIKYDYMTTDELGTDGGYIITYKEYGVYYGTYKGTYGDGERIGAYRWNYEADTEINDENGSNTWSTSLFNKTNLNTNFINYLGTTWANKIATTTWKVGGNTHDNIVGSWDDMDKVIPSITYQNEITNPDATNTTDNATTYDAKIGLMYVSDYGFAASPSAWGSEMYNYRQEDMPSKNWMYMGLLEWTISRNSDNSYGVFRVDNDGGLSVFVASGFIEGRASFNLVSSITYKSGMGSMSDPIIIN